MSSIHQQRSCSDEATYPWRHYGITFISASRPGVLKELRAFNATAALSAFARFTIKSHLFTTPTLAAPLLSDKGQHQGQIFSNVKLAVRKSPFSLLGSKEVVQSPPGVDITEAYVHSRISQHSVRRHGFRLIASTEPLLGSKFRSMVFACTTLLLR